MKREAAPLRPFLLQACNTDFFAEVDVLDALFKLNAALPAFAGNRSFGLFYAVPAQNSFMLRMRSRAGMRDT